MLAKLAEELGETLLPAFDTPTGLPGFSVDILTYVLFTPLKCDYFLMLLIRGKIKSDGGKDTVLFAEAASCQLEFKYLAKITGRKEFYQRVRLFICWYVLLIFFIQGSSCNGRILQSKRDTLP